MSSSKVFKQDPHFTPTTLVRRSIAPLKKENPPAAAQTDAPDEPELEEIQVDLEAPAVNDEPGPASLPPEPAIDLDALRQEAYSQGMADATARFQAEVTQVVAAFADGCQKIDSHRKIMFQHNRAELVNLLILLVQKILRQELTTPRTIVAATLEAALEQAIESEEYYVTLHPEDLAAAEAKVPELVAAVRGLARLVLKTDATMTRGGCLLESAVCTVDASIETQVDSLREFIDEHPLFVPAPDDAQTAPPEPPTAAPPV